MGIRSWLKGQRFLSLGAGNEHRSDHIFHFFISLSFIERKYFLLSYKRNVEGKTPKNMIQKKLSHFFCMKGAKMRKIDFVRSTVFAKAKEIAIIL